MPARVLGVTGPIGCGKSAACWETGRLGATVIDADQIVHELMAADGPLAAAIQVEFGAGMIGPDGGVDRPALGLLVFEDQQKLLRLEAIVHPFVERHIGAVVADCRVRSENTVLTIEAIHLVDSKLSDVLDRVWIVTCDRESQFRRLIENRNYSREKAESLMAATPSFDTELPVTTIVNDGSREALRLAVERAWAEAFGDWLSD